MGVFSGVVFFVGVVEIDVGFAAFLGVDPFFPVAENFGAVVSFVTGFASVEADVKEVGCGDAGAAEFSQFKDAKGDAVFFEQLVEAWCEPFGISKFYGAAMFFRKKF